MEVHEYQIKIMKVALAIAIIRQKPENISARDFTLCLVGSFKEDEQSWKERTKQLQQELIEIRQELVQYKLHAAAAEVKTKAPCNHSNINGVAEEDDDWKLLDIACDDGSRHAEEMEVENTVPVAAGSFRDHRIGAHVKFLASVSKVINIHKDLPAVFTDEVQGVVKDTILDALKDLKESLSSSSHCLAKLPYSKKALMSVVSCIRDFIVSPLLSPVRKEVLAVAVALAETLISDQSFRSRQLNHSLMLTLCDIKAILLNVIPTLVRGLCTSLELLHGTLKDDTLLNAPLIDELEGHTAMLEAVLAKYSKNIEEKSKFKMAEDLEGSLFLELSDICPLLTYAIWRIVSMLVQ